MNTHASTCLHCSSEKVISIDEAYYINVDGRLVNVGGRYDDVAHLVDRVCGSGLEFVDRDSADLRHEPGAGASFQDDSMLGVSEVSRLAQVDVSAGSDLLVDASAIAHDSSMLEHVKPRLSMDATADSSAIRLDAGMSERGSCSSTHSILL